MKYVSSLVVAVTQLLSPLVAVLEGIAVGVETTPGLLTWLGAAVIVGSSVVIVTNSRQQSTTVYIS